MTSGLAVVTEDSSKIVIAAEIEGINLQIKCSLYSNLIYLIGYPYIKHKYCMYAYYCVRTHMYQPKFKICDSGSCVIYCIYVPL